MRLSSLESAVPTTVVCFRGTTSISEAYEDLKSFIGGDFCSHNGSTIGRAASGFIDAYKQLIDTNFLEETMSLLTQTENRLLIIGHSLGIT
jgi:hypothetical protein